MVKFRRAAHRGALSWALPTGGQASGFTFVGFTVQVTDTDVIYPGWHYLNEKH
jgi:hypothetical protein